MDHEWKQFCDMHLCITHWHNVQIMELRRTMRQEHYDEIRKGYTRLRGLHPRGILGCAIVRPAMSGAPLDSSREGAQVMKEFSDVLRLVTVVIEGAGIWLTSVRTILRGINVISRNHALKICDDLGSAAGELAPLVVDLCRTDVTSKDVLASIQRASIEYDRFYARPSSSAPRSSG